MMNEKIRKIRKFKKDRIRLIELQNELKAAKCMNDIVKIYDKSYDIIDKHVKYNIEGMNFKYVKKYFDDLFYNIVVVYELIIRLNK